MYEVFQQFGEINCIRTAYFRAIGDTIGYIEFRDEQVAAKMLTKRQIVMKHQMIKIMKPINIPRLWISDDNIDSFASICENDIEEYPLFRPPELDSPNNILNTLNDDCLYRIFKKCSTLLTLCSIANVCVRI